jgi:hypothetical protein
MVFDFESYGCPLCSAERKLVVGLMNVVDMLGEETSPLRAVGSGGVSPPFDISPKISVSKYQWRCIVCIKHIPGWLRYFV